MPELRIQLLGDFRLSDGDQLLTTVNTSRLQALLAYLILHRDAPSPASTWRSSSGPTRPRRKP